MLHWSHLPNEKIDKCSKDESVKPPPRNRDQLNHVVQFLINDLEGETYEKFSTCNPCFR